MSPKMTILGLLSIGIVAGCSQARDTATFTFEELDRNANGAISMQEAKAMPSLASGFKAIDSNGDGKLSISEFQSHMGKGRMTPPEEMETPEPGAAPY